jgi:hypothetical protein
LNKYFSIFPIRWHPLAGILSLASVHLIRLALLIAQWIMILAVILKSILALFLAVI